MVGVEHEHMTRRFIVIDREGIDGNGQPIRLNPLCLPVDTDAEQHAAQVALRDAGIGVTEVWVGSPDDPDSYPSDGILFALP